MIRFIFMLGALCAFQAHGVLEGREREDTIRMLTRNPEVLIISGYVSFKYIPEDRPEFQGINEITLEDLQGLGHDLSRIKKFWIVSTNIQSLPENLLSEMRNLEYIRICHNQRLTTLPETIFHGLGNLIDLDMCGNAITILPPAIFRGLTNLEAVELCLNQLQTLDEGIFQGLTSLEILNLRRNKLRALPATIFDHLPSLKYLSISRELNRLRPEIRIPHHCSMSYGDGRLD